MKSFGQRYTRKRMVPFLIFAVISIFVGLFVITGHGFYFRGIDKWSCSPSFLLDLKDFLGLQNFYSQFGQDTWVLGDVYPGINNGFFMDIGSGDAEIMSNSKALEESGWNGICVDPFPSNWKNRKCQLFKDVVYSRGGEVVRFREAGFLGGIDRNLDIWKNEAEQYPTVELTTKTAASILKEANAPSFIHYVSIDTEGSEMEVLKGFPFSEYTVGAFTIEHNYNEPLRSQIRYFLEQKGYRLERSLVVDDCYVLADKHRLSSLVGGR